MINIGELHDRLKRIGELEKQIESTKYEVRVCRDFVNSQTFRRKLRDLEDELKDARSANIVLRRSE